MNAQLAKDSDGRIILVVAAYDVSPTEQLAMTEHMPGMGFTLTNGGEYVLRAPNTKETK